MDNTRWRLLVSGRVQGVYYRASTQEMASSLGLTGYACNLPDGRVQIIAEGPKDGLNQLKTWCADGPPAARVDSVDATLETPTGEFSDFGVR